MMPPSALTPGEWGGREGGADGLMPPPALTPGDNYWDRVGVYVYPLSHDAMTALPWLMPLNRTAGRQLFAAHVL